MGSIDPILEKRARTFTAKNFTYQNFDVIVSEFIGEFEYSLPGQNVIDASS